MELLQIATFQLITKCDGQLLQIASAFLLQSAMNLLKIATGITKCGDYYKLRQYSSTLFSHISLPLFSMTTTRNFQKPFYGGNVVRVLIHIFFTAADFFLALVATSISHFLSLPLKNFHVFLPTKNFSFIFSLSLQISVALFLVEFRWPAAYSLFFSVFLLLYVPNLWT